LILTGKADQCAGDPGGGAGRPPIPAPRGEGGGTDGDGELDLFPVRSYIKQSCLALDRREDSRQSRRPSDWTFQRYPLKSPGGPGPGLRRTRYSVFMVERHPKALRVPLGCWASMPVSRGSSIAAALAQREDEDVNLVEEGRFRCAGGDFQGKRVYQSDPPIRHSDRSRFRAPPKSRNRLVREPFDRCRQPCGHRNRRISRCRCAA